MFKTKIYNTTINEVPAGKYEAEKAEISSFGASTYNNVGFEYEDNKTAYNAYNSVLAFIRKNGLPMRAVRRGTTVIVAKA